jgi:hypothetical protein
MKKSILLLQFVAFYSSAQNIYAFAGNGNTGFSGDGGIAVNAQLKFTEGVAVDANGNVYITDSNNHRIRKVAPGGIITTICGQSSSGFFGNGILATSASLNNPTGITIDAAGNIYFCDSGNSAIRKINTSGIITTLAGNGIGSYSGDGGPAVSATLSNPKGISVDGSGNIYIADYSNNCIRKISSTGTITTIAGNGSPGFSGDGGLAVSSQLSLPEAVLVDASGNIYISDSFNHRVREINTSGIINTIAGNGGAGFSGDGGNATLASVKEPRGLILDGTGNLFIASNSGRIRVINSVGIINTFCGTGVLGNSGNGGPANLAQMILPTGLAIDPANNVFLCDPGSSVVRIICSTSCPLGTGIDGIDINGLSPLLSPNPVLNILNLKAGNADLDNSVVKILNFLGETVLMQDFSNTVDVSTLPIGVYNLKIVSQNNQTYNFKFIKE